MEAFRTVTGKGKRRSSIGMQAYWSVNSCIHSPHTSTAHSGTGLHASDSVKGDELISSWTEQYAWEDAANTCSLTRHDAVPPYLRQSGKYESK